MLIRFQLNSNFISASFEINIEPITQKINVLFTFFYKSCKTKIFITFLKIKLAPGNEKAKNKSKTTLIKFGLKTIQFCIKKS